MRGEFEGKEDATKTLITTTNYRNHHNCISTQLNKNPCRLKLMKKKNIEILVANGITKSKTNIKYDKLIPNQNQNSLTIWENSMENSVDYH